MESRQPPIYAIMPGRCYRRDTPDATHSPTFLQVESLVVDRGITLADLKGTVLAVLPGALRPRARCAHADELLPVHRAFGEFDVTCFLCNGQGCAVCKHSGWIEMGGAGLGRPARVQQRRLRPRGVARLRVRARIERIAMLRHGLDDLRLFWENDVRVLEQF